MSQLTSAIESSPYIRLQQVREGWELLGFETRNKYRLIDSSNRPFGYAAEQQKGILGLILRNILGHWRNFEIHIFNENRQTEFIAKHPFRFYFERLEILDATGRPIGALQKRFSILSKKFDVEGPGGETLLQINAPFWKFWTFPVFNRSGNTVAKIMKKWSGGLYELFTDRDNFLVEFESTQLSAQEKILLLVGGIFVDLQYFEKKAG